MKTKLKEEKSQEGSLTNICLKQLFSSIPYGILATDAQGNITIYNEEAETLLAVSKKKVLSSSFWSYFQDCALGFSFKEALEKRKIVRNTQALIKGAEEKRIATDTVPLILQQNGGFPPLFQGLAVFIRDITEQKYLEEINYQNKRMIELGELAGALAHEIRNPLGGIKGFASLLERDLIDKPDLKKMASYIVEGTDNLDRLVAKVLTYARPLSTHFAEVDLVPLLNELQEEMHSYKKNLAIKFSCNQKTLLAVIDPQLIRQCVKHLIINAGEATEANPSPIVVSLEKNDSSVLIKVSDAGKGIPSENQKKLFTPFFTTKPQGSGFGLSQVYKIMRLHGAAIGVDSTEGQGSTFSLKIPLKRVKE